MLMTALAELQADSPIGREALLVMSDVSWQSYEALLKRFGDDQPGYHIIYLDGILEITSSSRRHEIDKAQIGALVEIYCEVMGVNFFPLGSTTFRDEPKRGGIEPDESYCIGSDKEFPDLAIEVIVTSGNINKLDVYQRLGVLEVWFWQNNALKLYRLQPDGEYQQVAQSGLLPDLDLAVLSDYIPVANALEARRGFRQAIGIGPTS
jgi:Uma2 family endonuclease